MFQLTALAVRLPVNYINSNDITGSEAAFCLWSPSIPHPQHYLIDYVSQVTAYGQSSK